MSVYLCREKKNHSLNSSSFNDTVCLAAQLNLILTGFGVKDNHTAPREMRGSEKTFGNTNRARGSFGSDFNDTSLSGSRSDTAERFFFTHTAECGLQKPETRLFAFCDVLSIYFLKVQV